MNNMDKEDKNDDQPVKDTAQKRTRALFKKAVMKKDKPGPEDQKGWVGLLTNLKRPSKRNLFQTTTLASRRGSKQLQGRGSQQLIEDREEERNKSSSEESDLDTTSTMATTMISRKYRKQTAKQRLPPAGDPMAIIGYEGSRHNVHDRLPSAGRARTASVRVVELTNDTIRQVSAVSSDLKHFDMSRLHLVKINEDVMNNMDNLERLNLSYNELTEDGLPKYKIQRMKNLVELDMSHNLLTSLPAVFLRLTNLTRLNLGHNKLTSVDGIDKLRTLKVLVLENNNLERLPSTFYRSMKKLEVLILANNKMRSLPPDVRYASKLHHVDFSNNLVANVPPTVFFLPLLEVLDLSYNKLSRIPTLNINKTRHQKILVVDLSYNIIRIFPDFLMKFVQKLNLSYNKIRAITYKLLRQLDSEKDHAEQVLEVEGNPIKNIPQEVCDAGLRSIVHALIEMQMNEVVYRGLRVLVVGDQGCGKTSMIQSLLDEQSCLADEDDPTYGVDVYDHIVPVKASKEGEDDKNLNITFWDFSGHPVYHQHNSTFLQNKSLVAITFNLETFTRTKFQSQIAFWFSWMLAKYNNINALLVGTRADLVDSRKQEKIQKIISEEVQKFFVKRKQDIADERKSMENVPYLTPGMREYLLRHCNSILQFKYYVHPRVVMLSSKDFTGFDSLVDEMKVIAQNKTIFPEVLTIVPSLFKEAELLIESSRYEYKIPTLTREKFKEVVTTKFGLGRVIDHLATYMHESGKVFWAQDNPSLKDMIFIYPAWLTEVSEELFRHDFATMDYVVEENFKDGGVSESKFKQMREEIVARGSIDTDFFKGAWMNFVPNEYKQIKEVALMLCEKFEFCYVNYPKYKKHDLFGQSTVQSGLQTPMSQISTILESKQAEGQLTSRSGVSTKDARQDAAPSPTARTRSGVSTKDARQNAAPSPTARTKSPMGRVKHVEFDERSAVSSASGGSSARHRSTERTVQKIQVMWLMPEEPPPNYAAICTELKPCRGGAVLFTFPSFYPPGLFQTLCIRIIHSGFVPMSVWKTGFCGSHDKKPLTLFLHLLKDDKDRTCFQVEGKVAVKPEENLSEEQLGVLFWACMLPLLKLIDQLLNSMPGLWVKRAIRCPECSEAGFIAEYNTPKELQDQLTAQCDVCKKDVPTTFLVQPKEKKKIDEFLLARVRQRREGSSRPGSSQPSTARQQENSRLLTQIQEDLSPRSQIANLFLSRSFASHDDIQNLYASSQSLARELYRTHTSDDVTLVVPPKQANDQPTKKKRRPKITALPRIEKKYTHRQLKAIESDDIARLSGRTPHIEPFIECMY